MGFTDEKNEARGAVWMDPRRLVREINHRLTGLYAGALVLGSPALGWITKIMHASRRMPGSGSFWGRRPTIGCR